MDVKKRLHSCLTKHVKIRYSSRPKTLKFLTLDYPVKRPEDRRFNTRAAIRALLFRGLPNPMIQELISLALNRFVSLDKINWQRCELKRQGFPIPTSREIKGNGGFKWK